MISKTKIEKQIRRKNNPELVDTLIKLKKEFPEIAKSVARPVRNQIRKNLDEISKSKKKEVLIPGKVLGNGELEGKLKIIALSFSEKALEKVKKSGGEAILIKEAVDKNLKLNEFELLK